MANDSEDNLTEGVGDGPYIVQEGECVESIAVQNGLFWETIWNDSRNSKVKEKRGNPNLLYPGDRLHVRPIEIKEEQGAIDQKHTFVRKGVPSALHIQLMEEGKARKNLKYRLVLGNKEFTGSTDDRGRISHSVPPDVGSGMLYLGDNGGEQYRLRIRGLDPINTAKGIQARLRNLNYYIGEIDGIIGPLSRAAIRLFQDVYDLQVDGIAGPKTQAKLKEIHGS